MKDVYEDLRRVLNTHPSGAPKSAIFDRILRILFTPEEAELASVMSFAPMKVDKIASAAGMTAEKASSLLEKMAARVVIFSQEKDGSCRYGLLPTIPGLFEYPLMKGAETLELKELGKLWEEYHKEALGASFAGTASPLMRVVPVEKSIPVKSIAHPYEDVRKLIEATDYIGLAQCACRVSLNRCSGPREACLFFGSPAKFLVKKGYAREIDKTEAMRVLDMSEEAGLVHTSNNTIDRASVICNCCPCCCTVLRGRTELDLANAFATSTYQAQVDASLCNGCGACVSPRCPVNAVELAGETAKVDQARCIGCGLCVTVCALDAVKLQKRVKEPEIFGTVQELGLKIVSEKGTLVEFIEVMKR